ncbi:hypothetical protein [Psychrobacter communis]|uniref:hypothetical protein n=1 Tax=Psychrobacter communis TaxID=2762238 RepID=UPI0038515352
MQELKNLTSLGLSNNRLEELPKDIIKLNKLNHLVIEGNNLNKLPDYLVNKKINIFI